MPYKLNPYDGKIYNVGTSSGGGGGTTVFLQADDGGYAHDQAGQINVHGSNYLATTASGHTVNLVLDPQVLAGIFIDGGNFADVVNHFLYILGDATSGVSTTYITNGLKVSVSDATTSQRGVAYYYASHFTVSAGQVRSKIASTSAPGIASFDSSAFSVDASGLVTFTKPTTSQSFVTDSGTATASSNTITFHATVGLSISGSAATVSLALQPATSSVLGGVIPSSSFSLDGSGNLGLNTVIPAKGGTGLVNPTANQIPVTQGSSNYTSVPVTTGQVLGGSTSGPKGLTLNGDNGIQISTDTSSINFKSPLSVNWQTITSSTTNAVIGRNYILKGSAAQTITPTYTNNTNVLSTRIYGGSAYPMTIAVGSSSGSPDTLMINGQTATTQIQANEAWATCEIVCTNVIPTEFTPGFFIYQCTWLVVPLSGTYTVN